MKMGRTTFIVIAALAIGLLAGNVMTGFAAPVSDVTTTEATATGWTGLGLRLGAAMRDAGGRLIDVVAELTGLDVDDVAAKRAEGESIADIAEEAGVSSDAVVDEALKIRTDLLDERVESGAITQDQADVAIDQMTTRLTERVESTDACVGCGAGGAYGAGGGMGGGRGGSRGAGGGYGGNGGVCVQTPTVTQ